VAQKKVVVGLGNPGSRYEKTRHNIGWLVLDRLADRFGSVGRAKARDGAASVRGRLDDGELILVKPTTYMNLSGTAVRKVLARERIPLHDLLIVVDDMALPFGRLRMRERGSAGGHNGLRSIIGELGTDDFARLRVGIGAPPREAVEHVLGDFAHAEQRDLDVVLGAAADAVEAWARSGAAAAANRWNPWRLDALEPPDADQDDDPAPATPATRATPATPEPDADGIVRTSTGWRRLLPGRQRSREPDGRP
jgi:PTH1 family peptidyl-tRNA hydrolase